MINLEEAENNIKPIVLKAGEMLRGYFSSGVAYYEKEGVDFTTEADRTVDSFLIEEIRKLYPQSNFLTEETAPADYSSMKDLGDLWVIDPLDGTNNFSRKNSNFAVSVALVEKGKSVLGFVYLPMSDKLYCAREDKEGAFLNGKSITVSSVKTINRATIACDWSWDLERRKDVLEYLTSLYNQARQIKSMGSAAADLASLAEGNIDAYLHSGFKPWDVAAAVLIIEKAGGIISGFDGKGWNIFDSKILASNVIIHGEILKALKKLI